MKTLSTEAQKWHDSIIEEYSINDQAGLLLLQTACEAFDRMRQAQKQLDEDGLTILDKWNQKKPHPAATIERDARSQMMMALKALQLDFDQ